jgi:glycosyltransferase involved in cell wall biosynthesis
VVDGKLQIALCITDLDVGGAERCLVQLATRMDRTRFLPVVYCLGPRPPVAEASCVPALEAAGIEMHCLGARTKWEIARVLRRLTGLLADRRPDLVQTFLFHANIVGRIAARRAGIPWVVSGIRVAEQGSRWHLWLERCTRRLVDLHVCVSESVARFTATRAGIPPEGLVVIPNGIDQSLYPADKPADLGRFGIPPQRRVVSYVGRLDRQKGVDWLVETAPQWLQRLPDCDLLLVGSGPLGQRLEQSARKSGVSDRVHFAGWQPDVREILAASRLLVLPSRWEGMPNVVLEAMASGLPIVASRCEGVDELLGPRAAEQTVCFGDSEAFADKVVAMLSEPRVAASLGDGNRTRVENHFSLAAMIDAYERLWESLARGLNEP